MWGALNNCQRHPGPERQRLGPLGMSSIKIKWQHLSNVPRLPLLQRCRCSNLHTMSRWNTEGIFMCLLWSHNIAFYVVPLQAKHGQEPFCIEKGPILFYSSMWMIFINEALFTVCFLRVLRVLKYGILDFLRFWRHFAAAATFIYYSYRAQNKNNWIILFSLEGKIPSSNHKIIST